MKELFGENWTEVYVNGRKVWEGRYRELPSDERIRQEYGDESIVRYHIDGPPLLRRYPPLPSNLVYDIK